MCSLPLGGLGTAGTKSLFRQKYLLMQRSFIPRWAESSLVKDRLLVLALYRV